MAVAQAAVYLARPLTSYRILSLGGDARTVGLVAASFALFPLFLAIPLGRFADSRRAGPLLGGGCAVQALACVLLGIAQSPVGIALASVVLGLGHLALALGVQAVVARESSEDRHDQHFGLLTAGVSVGQLVGPLLGGLLLSGRGDGALTAATSRGMFLAAGLAASAAVFGALADGSSRPERADAPAGSRGSVRTIVRTPGVPAGILASVAVLSAADVYTAYLPVLGEQRGIGPGVIGVLLALRAGASIVSRVGIGSIVQRIGRLRLIWASAASAAAALVAITVVDDVVALAALSLLVGLGLGFGQPLSMTMVVQFVPEHARATALAVRLTGNRLGQVAVPAAAGLVAGSAGVGAVFWLLGGLLVASAVTVARTAPPEPGPAVPVATDVAVD